MPVNKSNKKKKDFEFKFTINPFILLTIAVVLWSALTWLNSPLMAEVPEEVPLNNVIDRIKRGEVEKITIDTNTLNVDLKEGEDITTVKEENISFYELLSLNGIDPSMVPGGIYEKQTVPWAEIVGNLAIPLLSLGILVWVFMRATKSSGGLFSIGKSKARLFAKNDQNKIGFADVAGATEVKGELVEIVDFLKNPEKYRKLGARIPRGVLLIGPSGVGKTLLARAVAGEADVPFYSVAGSEFIEMIVGVGSSRVRDLFAVAKSTAPSLIFIDEIDAIGRHRGKAMAVSNDEREQTLNQILVEMDGFDSRTSVIVIAATNRPDMLDSALVRPGRFDRHIRLELPDIKEREEILKIHMKGKPFSDAVSIDRLSKQTVGFSGADIENMLNEAAILAARKGASVIDPKDLTEASTKVKLGPGKKLLQTDEERKIIAYHEAGHALVGSLNKYADPVSRISIVSRSASLGHTQFLPRSEMSNQTKNELLAYIESLMGGRAAEKLVFNEETIGAAGDIERATYIARKMVTDFGMSELGPVNLVSDNAGLWDATAQNKALGYSEKVSEKIDVEVQKIITTQLDNAVKTIKDNRKILDRLAQELLERETLEQDEFEAIMEEEGAVLHSRKEL